MIQRIQTIWLTLAAFANAGLFCFDLYRIHEMKDGVDTMSQLRVTTGYPLLLLAIVISVLPVVAVFMYKTRKRQRSVAVFSIIANIGFIAMLLTLVTRHTAKLPSTATGSYWIGSVLPVIAIVFLFLAIRGITKDEKLVKSQDRLR